MTDTLAVESNTQIQSNTQLDAQYELLSKALGTYFDPNGRATAEQIFDQLGYVVNQIFEDPANEFQALGLRSKDGSKPPVLVLPGGRPGNPISVGNEEFAANKQAILNWLLSITNDVQNNPLGLKPDVTGASRGGALTQLVASEFPTLIGSAVSFVSPGIDRETAAHFLENGGNPSQVRHYITDGDWRSLIGDVFIPGTVTVGTYKIPLLGENGADYATRKHSSGILADFSSFFPGVTLTSNKPTDLSLRQISVEELNRPDFTFVGEDWQAIVEKLRINNPNLLAFTTRKGAEEVRDHLNAGAILELFGEAIADINPVPPEQVNQPTTRSDVLFGSRCSDAISGLAGDDYIRGKAGDDRLYGNEGNDALIGGAGNDLLSGGLDFDVLTGGTGRDQFIFGDPEAGTVTAPEQGSIGVDRINDFNSCEDLIGLSKFTFTTLTEDLVSAFGTVTDDAAAELSLASLVYNTSNGKLFYNTDGATAGFGSGGGQFVTLFGQPTLLAENFLLV